MRLPFRLPRPRFGMHQFVMRAEASTAGEFVRQPFQDERRVRLHPREKALHFIPEEPAPRFRLDELGAGLFILEVRPESEGRLARLVDIEVRVLLERGVPYEVAGSRVGLPPPLDPGQVNVKLTDLGGVLPVLLVRFAIRLRLLVREGCLLLVAAPSSIDMAKG